MSTTSSALPPMINIEVEEGTDYSLIIDYTDSSTSLPVDLTGYTASLLVDDMMGVPDSFHTFTTEGGDLTIDAADGVINISIAKTVTDGLGFFRGFYNLYIVSPTPDFTKTKLCKGFLTVSPSVRS